MEARSLPGIAIEIRQVCLIDPQSRIEHSNPNLPSSS